MAVDEWQRLPAIMHAPEVARRRLRLDERAQREVDDNVLACPGTALSFY